MAFLPVPLRNLNPLSFLEEKLKTWTLAQKALLYIVTFCALGGGFYFLEYKPTADNLHRMKDQIRKLENQIATYKKAASNIEPFRKKLEESRKDLQRLMRLLPSEKEIPDLLEKISRIAAQQGLETILFQPQPERPHEFYATIPVQLVVRGNYNQFGSFLDKIGKLDRIIKVTRIRMIRESGSRIKIDCNLETYRFLQKEEARKQVRSQR